MLQYVHVTCSLSGSRFRPAAPLALLYLISGSGSNCARFEISVLPGSALSICACDRNTLHLHIRETHTMGENAPSALVPALTAQVRPSRTARPEASPLSLCHGGTRPSTLSMSLKHSYSTNPSELVITTLMLFNPAP